ncbi:hypothetical protein [Paraburkholderia sp. IW21]|uniref:hypothetical protein n=1 Tax=Paraburkholderia sp. IW21 TaxID=3242488 RepID=UPI003520E09D
MSHVVDGLSRTKHWAWGAVIVALCSFAYAKVPGVAHGGGDPAAGRGGMQYAGYLTPVSAESRAVPRPPANAPVRTGSIRADVARYNEERGSSRAMQRQGEDPRQQEGSPYRN